MNFERCRPQVLAAYSVLGFDTEKKTVCGIVPTPYGIQQHAAVPAISYRRWRMVRLLCRTIRSDVGICYTLATRICCRATGYQQDSIRETRAQDFFLPEGAIKPEISAHADKIYLSGYSLSRTHQIADTGDWGAVAGWGSDQVTPSFGMKFIDPNAASGTG